MTRKILSIAIAAALLALPVAPASALSMGSDTSGQSIGYETRMGNDCCY